MVKRLYINKKIEVRKSPIHGYGVFAKENIKKDISLDGPKKIILNLMYYH